MEHRMFELFLPAHPPALHLQFQYAATPEMVSRKACDLLFDMWTKWHMQALHCGTLG